LKITLIGPVYPYRGGIAHFTTLLALKLKEAGYEVQVVSFRKQFPKWLYPGKSDKDESKGRLKVKAAYVLSPLNPLDWGRTVRTIKNFHPDIVVFQWWVTVWGPTYQFLIEKLAKENIQTIALVHNTVPHEHHFFDKYFAKSALKRASRYIVMTDKEKIRLQALIGDVSKITVVPHPVYRLFSNSGLTKDRILNDMELPQDKVYLLFFGIIRPYKGLEVLFEALSILKMKGFDIHLIIAGEFWADEEKHKNEIKTLGIDDLVHIYDHYIPDNEVGNYFLASDIFVAPYLNGTQSGSLKTALGFGMPMVTTEVVADEMMRSLPEICIIVPPGNAQLLAKGIVEALNFDRLSKEKINELENQSWNGLVDAICK